MNFGTIVPVVCSIWVLSEILLSVLRRSGRSASHLDRSSLRIIWLTIVTAVPLGVFIGISGIGALRIGESVSWFGLLIILAGIAVRWWALAVLGKYFTVDVSLRDDHKMVTAGPYRRVRHPLYAGSLLSFLGLGLIFQNPLATMVIVVPMFMAFSYRIKIEERALIDRFGDEYLHYRQTTNSLLPGIF